MDYLDIFIFAAVAVFIFARLLSVLGRRDDDEPQKPNPFAASTPRSRDGEGPLALPDLARSLEPPVISPEGHALYSLAGTLDRIRALDASFDEKQFLQGAKTAFSLIVEGFARGDLPEISRWLAPSVLESFQGAVRARQAAGQTQESKIERISEAEISAARLEGSRAFLTVDFVSHQVNVLRDAQGRVVSGEEDRAEEIRDVWVFARDLTAKNPNWTLIETRSA